MEILYILIPIAMILVAIIIAVFIYAIQSNQFEDIERHGQDILMDEESPLQPVSTDSKRTKKSTFSE
jgi:cbb3-type cytochrome oxidase maturation protein